MTDLPLVDYRHITRTIGGDQGILRVRSDIGQWRGRWKLETSWDVLLDRGDEPFDISFPPVYGDGALLNSIVESEIARDTDAGHERFATYVTSKTVSHLNDAVQHFQLVLDQCPIGHPDHAGALTDLAWARLRCYIQKDLQAIDCITSLFRGALALRPQGHPNHALSIYHLIDALILRYKQENFTAVYIHESAQLSCKLLPLCPEGTYLRSIAAGADGIDFVICECNNLPIDASDEDIHLRRVVLKLCPLGNEHCPKALDNLAWALGSRFEQRSSIGNLEESLSLWTCFNCQDKYHDLNEAISLYKEALRLCPVGHESCDFSLDNLGVALFTRFNKRGDVNDINGAISTSASITRH
ncbi:hypothetical protein DFJ58DRAFT_748333 [Suillus subalutaceus]|uniref:uncharacterized protein n=1 Tax=Suillus subalutaceus TaxID=48586 RepID=UPI001B8793F6|nr:uncharacterized protein DFJ58DRAFT_748333 [Suillus subalutaceus]KAG1841941.1 hypothetical protein DFJ58DRAFT_748333 [Suillus subalutaceus]